MFEERYVLQEQIGDGRMSSVYLALDSASADSQVVVKMLNTAHPDDIKQELFKRETSALKKLSHPNIVRMLDSGWSESQRAFYLVLDYMPYTLDKYMKGELRSQLSNFKPYRVMRELADALSYAHSENVVHRDIKPSNILLDVNGRPLLTDFGISKLITHLTIGQTLAGFWSGGYASPEQRAGAVTGTQSDIFSLGSVFFHLLSGQEPPPEGPTPSLVDEYVAGPPPLKNVLRRMLAADPEQRLSRGAEILSALEITRRLETLPRHFLILTRTAISGMVSAGYSSTEDFQSVADVLLEDLGGIELEEVHVHRDQREQRDLIILGASLRLICTPDEKGTALVVKAVQTPYLPYLDIERGRSMPYRAMWEPVQQGFQSVENHPSLSTAIDDLTSLLAEVNTYEHVGAVSEERRRSRRDFIERWDTVLSKNRNRIERGSISLGYSEVVEEPDYLRFTLTNPPPDTLPWEDDTPLAVRESTQAPRHPIGNLVRIRGRVAEVARQSRRFHMDNLPIPRVGLLTVNVTEALVANRRQRDAVSSFLYEQMANPNLAHVIVDPAKATSNPEAELDYFQDWLSDDKKETVRRAVSTKDLFLIQGPPGTGKTSVIAEIVLQILKRDSDARILLTSQSNVAVDHALTQIAEAAGDSPPEMVRLGRVEKIGRGGRSWTLEERARSWRREVLDRCNPELANLSLLERKARATVREMDGSGDVEVESAGELEDWIAEAKEIAEQLQEYEEECSSLGSEVSTATKDAAAETVEQTRAELKEQLTALNELLLEPLDTQGLSEQDVLAEIIKATAPSNRMNLDTKDPATQELHRVQELRKTLTDWTRVVGLTQDFQELIARSSRVVAATCLFSGGRGGRAHPEEVGFDWAIVDEAGRATIPEVLIPIVKAGRAILVGDERQLPPMVEDIIDEEPDVSTDQRRLDTSLFEILVEQAEEAGRKSLASLRTQYRMHPSIGNLISAVFYEGDLKNGDQVRPPRFTFDWLPAPVTWLSTSAIEDRQDTRAGESYANPTETDIVLQLLEKLEEKCKERGRRPSVAIITGYAAQVERLITRVDPENAGRWRNIRIEIATVDSFQGRECDVVVYSTVRSNKEKRIGFLKDRRRINVALSRARELLIIVGDHFMMQTATIGVGPELNPFASVLDHFRSHPDECRIVQASLVKLL